MKYAFALFALLLSGCESATVNQKVADDFFKKAENQLMINCRGKYDLPALRDTFQLLRRENPDSAKTWASRLYLRASVGGCPE